jgi:hypothetical protein
VASNRACRAVFALEGAQVVCADLDGRSGFGLDNVAF